jgi:hypothetical protein
MKNNEYSGRDALLSDYFSTPLTQALQVINAMETMSTKSVESLLPGLELTGVEQKAAIASEASLSVRHIEIDQLLSQLAEMARPLEATSLDTTEQVIERMLCR